LPRHVETVTPENVRIEYELAGVASRCGAAAVDLLLQALAILVIVLVFLVIEISFHLSLVGFPTGVVIVSTFVLWWGYYVFFETLWNGQTPGKRLLRLRVVKYGGTPIDLPSAAIRGLIRVVDLAIIGFLVVFFTPRNQRLGDLAAGTLVVKERSEWTGDIAQPVRDSMSRMSSWNASPEAAMVKNIELVTPEQFETVKRFVERSDELAPETREQIAARIARPLMLHLLSAIHARCVTERGMR
jgi:uncharacterized RDD family membrane protein YckC